ncbi:MAG: VWA domain-containing protein [Verrucomicrobiota bacterium]|nr:VWA domain-containing protein [Verrucomicrobiota bacterium]
MNHKNKAINFVFGLLAIGFWFAPLIRAEVQVTDNVIVVVDASGSMGTPMGGTDRMSVAREALKQVLGQVPESTHIGVLVFPRGDWVYPLGSRVEQRLNNAIDSIRSGGGTPLGSYMKRGADALLEARKKQFGYGTYRLLVVTDGEANDRNLVEGYTPDIISRGITIDVIGVDMESEHTLATKVHTYRSADNPDSLRQAITEVFAEVSSADTGQTDEDAFELIADLPKQTASEMLKSLSTTGNDPIQDYTVMRRANPNTQSNSSSSGTVSPSPTNSNNESDFALLLLGCGCPIIILLGIYSVVKASKNKK